MRHRRIRDIVIELTSLLDIVMILIFAIMIENTRLSEEMQNNLKNQLDNSNSQIETIQEELRQKSISEEELRKLVDELSSGDKKDLAVKLQKDEEMLRAYDYIDSIVTTVNVTLENRNGNRYLSFGLGKDEDLYKSYTIAKTEEEDWKDAINQLKIFLNDVVSEKDKDETGKNTIYLVLTADYSKVYVDDYKEIEKAMMDAQVKNSKVVYYSNSIEKEKEKRNE